MRLFLSRVFLFWLGVFVFLPCVLSSEEIHRAVRRPNFLLGQSEVQNISNSDYFQAALSAINNSRNSIVMGMYIISLNPDGKESKVRTLLEALVSAKNRGVAVKVILEYHSLIDFTPKGLRYYAYHYLKDNGVSVFFDESANNCLHLKTIVVDEEIVVTGSSNWSEAAFTSSYETNLVVRSKQLAQEVLEDLESIPLRKDAGEKSKDVFCIPSSFCDGDSGRLKEMVHYDDVRSLDVILILWDKIDGSNVSSPDIYRGPRSDVLVNINCGEIAKRLGLLNRMDRIGWRMQIKKTLKKLEERYRLIHYIWRHGKDEIAIEFLNYPADAPINFPKDYFRYGWNGRLGLSGKAVLITMYAELGNETGNVISLPILYLSKRYGMKVGTYSKGIQELRRFNVIKAQYAKGFRERADTRISVLGVYDMDEFKGKIEELKVEHGAELVSEAQKFAEIIYCAYDLEIVKNIIEQMHVYDDESVRYAFSYVKKMRPDNYKRVYNYVLGILKRKGVVKK